MDVTNFTQQEQQVYSYYHQQGATVQQTYNKLCNAWWMANNSGFCDSMAGRLMAGESSAMIDEWEYACKHKYTICNLCQKLKEQL